MLIHLSLCPLHQDIGEIDTLIAAIAIEEHLTLVIIDTDFDQVPGTGLLPRSHTNCQAPAHTFVGSYIASVLKSR